MSWMTSAFFKNDVSFDGCACWWCTWLLEGWWGPRNPKPSARPQENNNASSIWNEPSNHPSNRRKSLKAAYDRDLSFSDEPREISTNQFAPKSRDFPGALLVSLARRMDMEDRTWQSSKQWTTTIEPAGSYSAALDRRQMDGRGGPGNYYAITHKPIDLDWTPGGSSATVSGTRFATTLFAFSKSGHTNWERFAFAIPHVFHLILDLILWWNIFRGSTKLQTFTVFW